MSRTPPSRHWTCSTDGTSSSSGIPAAEPASTRSGGNSCSGCSTTFWTPPRRMQNGGDRYWESHVQTLGRAEKPWWDDVDTPERENRDQTVTASLNAAAAGTRRTPRRGSGLVAVGRPAHAGTDQHASLGQVGSRPSVVVQPRPYQVGGGGSIVHCKPPGGNRSGRGMRSTGSRACGRSSTWPTSTTAHLGQSHRCQRARLRRHHRDQTEAWVTGEQYSWPFSRGGPTEHAGH